MKNKEKIDFIDIWKAVHFPTDGDQPKLDRWLRASKKNQSFFEKVGKAYLSDGRKEITPDQSNVLYQRIMGAISRRILWRNVITAASITLILTVGIGGLFQVKIMDTKSEFTDLAPGTNKATLVGERGELIDLSNGQNRVIPSKTAQIKCSDAILEYKRKADKNTSEKENLFNTLNIPTGGQFKLKLADGTIIWLNSETALRYPVFFSGKYREIELLHGEVYCQVAHDADHPFILKKGNQRVQVLGTEFNISSYQGESKIVTTLVGGKVSLSFGDLIPSQFELSPSEQLVFDSNNLSVSVAQVDPLCSTGWKDGNYYFEAETLGNILKILSRWYGFDYHFEDESIAYDRFSGSFNRNQNLNNILQVLANIKPLKFSAYENKMTIEKNK